MGASSNMYHVLRVAAGGLAKRPIQSTRGGLGGVAEWQRRKPKIGQCAFGGLREWRSSLLCKSQKSSLVCARHLRSTQQSSFVGPWHKSESLIFSARKYHTYTRASWYDTAGPGTGYCDTTPCIENRSVAAKSPQSKMSYTLHGTCSANKLLGFGILC